MNNNQNNNSSNSEPQLEEEKEEEEQQQQHQQQLPFQQKHDHSSSTSTSTFDISTSASASAPTPTPTPTCTSDTPSSSLDPSQEQQPQQHGKIHKIDRTSVQKIVAGQAITDLASAVKELVDNALDAGSESINVRLFNKGLDIIEVTDDGVGVPINSRQFLATPHATSKIRTFEDIYHCPEDDEDDDEEETDEKCSNNNPEDDPKNHDKYDDDDDDDDDDEQHSSTLSTMGFRGEALFCLANLSSKLMISTRTADEEMAQKMEFRRDGSLQLDTISYIPRKVGTSVAVVRLFDSVPVRRKDMVRRIQYQRSKLINMMEGYAIFSTGVRIHLMDIFTTPTTPTATKDSNINNNYNNSDGGGAGGGGGGGQTIDSKTLLATATNNRTIQETISSILGSKFLNSMTKIEIDVTAAFLRTGDGSSTKSNSCSSNDIEGIANSNSNNTNKRKKKHPQYKIHGYISKASYTSTSSFNVSGSGNTKAKSGCRQAHFFSINRRPVDLPKVSRLINDTWRSFGNAGGGGGGGGGGGSGNSGCTSSSLPSCVLQFTLPNNAFDVNVSPDKRQVLFTNERTIYEELQKGIIELWKSQADGQFVKGDNNVTNNSIACISKYCNASATNIANANNNVTKVSLTSLNHSIDDDDDHDIQQANCSLLQNSNDRCDDGTSVVFTTNDDSKTKRDDNNDDEDHDSSSDEFIASRRYGFSEDPTVAVQRECEDKKKKDEYIATKMNDPEGIISSSSSKNNCNSSDCVDEGIVRQSQYTDNCNTIEQIKPYIESCTIEEMSVRTDDPDSETCKFGHAMRQADSSQPTWGEQIQWRDAVTKFNASEPIYDRYHRHAERNVSIHHCVSVDRNVTKECDEGNTDLRKYAESSTVNQDSTTEDYGDPFASSSGRKRSSLGLEQFGFRAVKRVSDSSELKPSPSQNHHQSDVGNVVDTSISAVMCHTPRDSQKDNYKEESPYLRTVSLPPSSNLDSRHRNVTDSGFRAHSNELQVPIESDEVITCPTSNETLPSTTAVWNTITSTDDVIAACRIERQSMRSRRTQFRRGSMIDLQNSKHGFDSNLFGNQIETIQSPVVNSAAKQDTVHLTKDDFKPMKVIGQFNMGFILATTDDGNLWILDQHACDEKYNFEKLCRETVIHEQRLISPMPIELSPSEENCVLEHMDIFEKNGFRFLYSPDEPVRHRLALTALPHSGARDGRKAVQFGKDDVVALCEILGSASEENEENTFSSISGGTGVDGSGRFGNNAVKRHAATSFGSSNGLVGESAGNIVARLPKAIAMFASRACRGSIMIGRALSEMEMDKIIKRLADVEHPWNCPHGRPTIRHVSDLKSVMENDAQAAAEHLAGPTVSMLSQE